MTKHRVALISDIHANEVALNAVFEDIARSGVDLIACLGDTATLGPRPREVLALLRDRCGAFIQGNHDEYMFAPDLIKHHTQDPGVIASVDWCRGELRADEVTFLKTFDRTAKISLGAAGDLFLFHGSPASNNKDLLAETPDEELAGLLDADRTTVMSGGHTHIQMMRQHRGTLLVNPGSVGLPFERYVSGGPPTIMSYAEYAVVEASGKNVAVTLHRVALDTKRLLDDARSWKAPLAPYLVQQYEAAA